jgi:ribose/xylose/arabinose/galactoside ABC-type transport system permease subunit
MRANRRLFFAAAVLVAAAAWLPYWGFVMSAPQYPDESLVLNVSRLGITGDVQEVETLQQYIGVQFPKDLSELDWLVPAMLALAAVLAIGGAAGAGLAGLIVRWTGVALFVALLAFCAVTVQRNLYAVGHDRDRNAPITAIKDFTPRLIGPTKVGNFTVWSFPHIGGLALVAALSLAAFGSLRGVRT